jgi:hypothetical protein
MRCIVFTHFERENIKGKSGKQVKNPLENKYQKKEQRKKWRKQLRPYSNSKCRNIKLIYIFIIDGYEALLKGEIPFEALMMEKRMRKVLEDVAKELGVKKKLQIIGIEELLPTLAHLQGIAVSHRKKLNFLLLGGGKTPYYDSPKMVEAFIRLARGTHINTDEVILRIDQDVAVNPKSIDKLIEFHDKYPYRKRKDQYHFLSGNYRFNESIHKPEDLLNDYAIRTHHFLKIKDEKQKKIYTKILFRGHPRYDIAKNWLDSIADIGADPYNQVISGAGLSMSLKAISELPPFANAGSPILWIDDHIKRRLHEALGHLPPPPAMDVKSVDKSYRCCHQANFKQDRHPYGVAQKDINWAKHYLPRLVRGIVIDNLIWDHDRHKAGVYIDYVNRVLHKKFKLTEDTSEKLKGVLKGALGRSIFEILDKIEELWSAKCYKEYPVYNYAKNILPDEKSQLYDQVIEALHSYLMLLSIWEPFVRLWRHVRRTDPEYKWLFRNP